MIYDCFLWDGETEILDVRRKVLAPLGVRHVPIVSDRTFSGRERPIPGIPDGVTPWVSVMDERYLDAWLREDLQRNAVVEALGFLGALPYDVVIAGDVDEIPTPEAVDACRVHELTAIRMPYHQLLATWRLPLERDSWHRRHPVVGRFEAFTEGFANARDRSRELTYQTGGWHLSCMGGRRALDKFTSFSHHDEPWAEGFTLDRLKQHALVGRDVAGRFDLERCSLDELPAAVADHPALLDIDAW